MIYHTCSHCGAHLDPGEVCDCLKTEAKLLISHLTEDECTTILEMYKNTAASSAKADSGKETQQGD